MQYLHILYNQIQKQIVFSTKIQPNTKGLKKIPIITFNDPELTVCKLTQDDIINGNADNKLKKRKKENTKQRIIDRNKLLKWDAMKKKGGNIDFNDVLNEYLARQNLDSYDDIDESIWTEWNDHAVVAAESEIKRMKDVERVCSL